MDSIIDSCLVSAFFPSQFYAATNHVAVIVEVAETAVRPMTRRHRVHWIRVDCALADTEVQQQLQHLLGTPRGIL